MSFAGHMHFAAPCCMPGAKLNPPTLASSTLGDAEPFSIGRGILHSEDPTLFWFYRLAGLTAIGAGVYLSRKR